jgi:two-component system nitrogen regulation sensor histidine kinase NtrY
MALTERPGRRPLFRRVEPGTGRRLTERRLAVALATAAIVFGFATYAALTRSSPEGSSGGSDALLALLACDVLLVLVFGALLAKQLIEAVTERRRGLAGSRLHIQLVVLFSTVAVAPTAIVAVFSYLVMSLGMESWFSEKVRTALDESRAVAQAYLEEHQQNIRSDALSMAGDLNGAALKIASSQAFLGEVIASEVAVRGFTEAIVFDAPSSRVLGRSALSFTLELEPIPQWALQKAESGEVAILTSQNHDRVRALVRLEQIPNAMLYVGRPVEPRVLGHISETDAAVEQYHRLEAERGRFQVGVFVIFGAAAALLLLVAIWIGLNFATRISRRISGLALAAERVRLGDLSARVAEVSESDEFGSLSRAFNRMTDQLESQRADLVEANLQLDQRRRFTETVLAGVSAGVIGLDEQGNVHLPNRRASTLLGIDFETRIGEPLSQVVPAMATLVSDALATPERQVEGQIRLVSRGRPMVLLVRIGTEREEAAAKGFVVTFDDITELLQAQRKAAWADVARRIAHEMKNPLTPIQLSAERLKRKYLSEIKSDPDTFAICTDTIIRQVGDIGRMVDEFSSFARMPAPVMKPENLQDLTRQATFLQKTANPDITFTVDIPTEPLDVSCDARQISQALINLLQNAIDAIHTRELADANAGRAADPGRIDIHLERRDDRIALVVEDNGKGLPIEGRDQLTEPYVTTRAKGTGLGLAIVKKVMEDHAGELVLEDGSLGGARVSLVFPAGTVRRPPTDPQPLELVTHGA